jgi:hypothetical protein
MKRFRIVVPSFIRRYLERLVDLNMESDTVWTTPDRAVLAKPQLSVPPSNAPITNDALRELVCGSFGIGKDDTFSATIGYTDENGEYVKRDIISRPPRPN